MIAISGPGGVYRSEHFQTINIRPQPDIQEANGTSLHVVAVYIFLPLSKSFRFNINAIQRYRIRWVIIIACIWTAVDILSKIAFTAAGRTPSRIVRQVTAESISIRTLVVLLVSLTVSYLLVFQFRGMFRTLPPWRSVIGKGLILVCFAILGNFLIHTTYTLFILHYNPLQAAHAFWIDSTTGSYLIERTMSWMITFTLTLLVIEINEKYSPGLFFSIIFGSYANPRVERRIVMFLDLKDSTPIAEKLGTSTYFSFIRDFIYYVSSALIEYGGNIYQYVGDEVVTSWPTSPASARKCLKALAEARKQLRKHRPDFMKKYGIIPEYRVGIHEGEVTVGEIGIVKKDLAMSGDTMNTAARIRTACGDLNMDVLASNAFIRLLQATGESHDHQSIGVLELKGKATGLELYSYSI